jgi:plastocyanin
MRTQDIRRVFASVALGLLAALTFAPATASASGGGGCGGPVTEATGSAIEIANFCFEPTILRLELRGAVTFTNADAVPHTVLGANATWGDYDELKRGDEVIYRFSTPGIYPYVCTWHPGMVGAIVVGGGTGAASELDVENASARSDRPGPSDGNVTWMVAGGLALGAVFGAVGATIARRRRNASDQPAAATR